MAVLEAARAMGEGLENRHTDKHRAYRRIAAAQTLGNGHQIRRDAFLLAGVQGAGAAHAAHHFVEDQQHAITIADLPNALEVACGGGHRAERRADHGFGDESDYRFRSELEQARFELVRGAFAVRLRSLADAPIAVLVAGIDMMAGDQNRRERLAPPGIAADGERAQRVAVIALSAGNEMTALRLLALDEVLPCHLERRFDRLRSAGDEIDLGHARRRVRDQLVRQFLGDLGGEETGVGVGEAVELLMHRRDDRRMLMPQTRNRRAAARVDVVPPFAVDEKHAFAPDSEWIAMMNL